METLLEAVFKIRNLPQAYRDVYENVCFDSGKWPQINPAVIAIVCSLNQNSTAEQRNRLYLQYLGQNLPSSAPTKREERRPREEGGGSDGRRRHTRARSRSPRRDTRRRDRATSYHLVKPVLRRYELVGDSCFRRLASEVMEIKATRVDGKTIVGLCVGGATIEDATVSLNGQRMGETKNKILVMAGTNDILKNITSPPLKKRIENLVEAMNRTCSKGIICVPPPLPRHTEEENKTIQSMENLLKEEAGKYASGKISILNSNSLFINDDGSYKETLFKIYRNERTGREEVTHLNTAGLRVLYSQLRRAIDEFEQELEENQSMETANE